MNDERPNRPACEPIGLNPVQAARALSISRRTLSALVANRDSGIPVVRLGKRVVFPRARLQEWLESRIERPR